MYEPGHAFGVEYRKGEIPTTDDLLDDLDKMLQLYGLLVARGGVEYTESQRPLPMSPAPENRYEEKGRYRNHRRRDRNPKLSREAKELHGYACQICGFDFRVLCIFAQKCAIGMGAEGCIEKRPFS